MESKEQGKQADLAKSPKDIFDRYFYSSKDEETIIRCMDEWASLRVSEAVEAKEMELEQAKKENEELSKNLKNHEKWLFDMSTDYHKLLEKYQNQDLEISNWKLLYDLLKKENQRKGLRIYQLTLKEGDHRDDGSGGGIYNGNEPIEGEREIMSQILKSRNVSGSVSVSTEKEETVFTFFQYYRYRYIDWEQGSYTPWHKVDEQKIRELWKDHSLDKLEFGNLKD